MDWRTPLALSAGLVLSALVIVLAGAPMTTVAKVERVGNDVQRSADRARPPQEQQANSEQSSVVSSRRPVAPSQIAPPPLESDALERIAPRAPLSEFGQPLVRKRDPMTRLFRPIADAAGRISAGDITVTIAGLEVVDPDRVCTDQAGREWPCGIRARTAFRAFLRGRAVECAMPPDLAVKTAEVACRLGKADIGTWLVSSGWAEALEGGPYADVAATARRARRGLFGPAPVAQ